MSSEEDKLRHSKRRKRNFIKQDMVRNELRGAFAIKILDARKPEYERKKVRVTELYEEYEDEANN